MRHLTRRVSVPAKQARAGADSSQGKMSGRSFGVQSLRILGKQLLLYT